jgi:hypothetical protein
MFSSLQSQRIEIQYHVPIPFITLMTVQVAHGVASAFLSIAL